MFDKLARWPRNPRREIDHGSDPAPFPSGSERGVESRLSMSPREPAFDSDSAPPPGPEPAFSPLEEADSDPTSPDTPLESSLTRPQEVAEVRADAADAPASWDAPSRVVVHSLLDPRGYVRLDGGQVMPAWWFGGGDDLPIPGEKVSVVSLKGLSGDAVPREVREGSAMLVSRSAREEAANGEDRVAAELNERLAGHGGHPPTFLSTKRRVLLVIGEAMLSFKSFQQDIREALDTRSLQLEVFVYQQPATHPRHCTESGDTVRPFDRDWLAPLIAVEGHSLQQTVERALEALDEPRSLTPDIGEPSPPASELVIITETLDGQDSGREVLANSDGRFPWGLTADERRVRVLDGYDGRRELRGILSQGAS